MVKIIGEPDPIDKRIFYKKCAICDTKFTYQYEDTRRDILDFFENDGNRHVICPFCGSREWASMRVYVPERDGE